VGKVLQLFPQQSKIKKIIGLVDVFSHLLKLEPLIDRCEKQYTDDTVTFEFYKGIKLTFDNDVFLSFAMYGLGYEDEPPTPAA